MRLKKNISNTKDIYDTLSVNGWQGGSYHDNHSQRSTSYLTVSPDTRSLPDVALYYSQSLISVLVMSNSKIADKYTPEARNPLASIRALSYFEIQVKQD